VGPLQGAPAGDIAEPSSDATFQAYGSAPLDQDRRPAENLRLLVFATASSDSAGNWSAVFDPVPLGFGWWGTIAIPALGASMSAQILVGSKVIGSIPGPSPWGPIVALSGERVSLTATGLTPNEVYQGVWVGIIRDTLDVRDLVAPMPVVTPLAGGGSTVVFSGDLSGTDAGPQTVVGIQGNPVSPVAPVNGDVMAWEGSVWLPTGVDFIIGPLGGDLTGDLPSPTIANLQGTPLSVLSPTNGEIIQFNGTAFALASLPSSLPPSGAAGGDLAGTYPNPTVAGTANVESIISANTTVAGALQETGGTMSGAIAMGANKITGLADGSGAQDAAAFGQIPTALPPNGAAGGSLAGTYPNPTIESSVPLPGSPTTTTQAALDNSTKVATTAYTDAAVAVGVAAAEAASIPVTYKPGLLAMMGTAFG
jgi:hypothetical protein